MLWFFSSGARVAGGVYRGGARARVPRGAAVGHVKRPNPFSGPDEDLPARLAWRGEPVGAEVGAVKDLRAGRGVEPVQAGAGRAHRPDRSSCHDRRPYRAHTAGTPGTGGGAAGIAGAEGGRRSVDAEAHDALAFAGQLQTAVRVRDGAERGIAVDADTNVSAG